MYMPGTTAKQEEAKEPQISQNLTQQVQAKSGEERQFLIAPELLALIEKVKAKESNQGQQAEVSTPTKASEEDWKWLRGEVDRRLALLNPYDSTLSHEERARLFEYRAKIRDLPNTIGSMWTPSTVIWPTRA